MKGAKGKNDPEKRKEEKPNEREKKQFLYKNSLRLALTGLVTSTKSIYQGEKLSHLRIKQLRVIQKITHTKIVSDGPNEPSSVTHFILSAAQ